MKKSTIIAGIIFLALSLAEVISLSLGVESLHPWIKPFLVPSLAAAALCALLPEHKGRLTVLLIVGMAFHTLGDIMLLLDNRGFVFFALGLAAFLIGHFFYLAVLLHKMGRLNGWKEILCWLMPLLLSGPAPAIFDVSGVMRVVLAVYAITLLYVAASGVLWVLRGRKPGWRVLAGGLFFVASDAVLALGVFNGVDFPLRHAFVIGTYLIAEWLLVSGMVRQRQLSKDA